VKNEPFFTSSVIYFRNAFGNFKKGNTFALSNTENEYQSITSSSSSYLHSSEKVTLCICKKYIDKPV